VHIHVALPADEVQQNLVYPFLPYEQCQIRPHGPAGALDKLGAPVLLETLALHSCMTFENAKVAKIGKKRVFFKLK